MKHRFKLPYEPPRIIDLGGEAHAQSELTAVKCQLGGSPSADCKPGSQASGTKCQPGSSTGGACNPGSSASGTKCQGGSVAGGQCKPGSVAAAGCKVGSAPR